MLECTGVMGMSVRSESCKDDVMTGGDRYND
jgi:hypothetical protein